MGQDHSRDSQQLSLEQLSSKLTQRFAQQCYTPLELYCFNSVFKSLADSQSGLHYWSESTLCRFLELPDALNVGPVLFQMASYIGAFPFPTQAPAILTNEALLKVVTILTERYGAVFKRKSRRIWLGEIYRSMAVYDRGLQAALHGEKKNVAEMSSTNQTEVSMIKSNAEKRGSSSTHSNDLKFAIDKTEDSEDVSEDDDLVLAAFDSMDLNDTFKHGEVANIHHSIIPSDNLLKLLELLLLSAPMEPHDNLSTFALQLSDKRIVDIRATANSVLSAFSIEKNPGVTFKHFNVVISSALPYLFDGLRPLFEHFLFAKDFDLSRKKGEVSSSPQSSSQHSISVDKRVSIPEPVLQTEGDIMNLSTLSQLSFIIKGNNLFRRLRLLYSGNTNGFSMGSFEKSVFNWRAPSILLVSGTLLGDPLSARERAMHDSLPHSRLKSSLTETSKSTSTTVTYGAYISQPWKQTHKSCFGDSGTVLFQIAPTHDVFGPSKSTSDYVYFNRAPTHPSGLGFGSSIPSQGRANMHSSNPVPIPLGPVSLHLDDGLEFATFTHLSEGGGSFYPSQLPIRKARSWQDRFEVESLEVWGCGGDEEADAQRRQWAWEEREAEARRKINLGTGDVEMDKELLRMAGLIGANQSGGSMA
ncbi:restriction of telomere capping protein 5 [Pseudovirgaria hyperparasitica]|uniref:Restriction of telomere capping protein 5 n=1 Tax=Pseudovirgaria hyperparasitica TaxID=470096 RepID=A0A6A6VYZ0_9PEZI|nr:restriction of telomere capping protein 5 [Pseudovirgaria hyperparasitica]KAF2754964.1 restriction of telomere capping protein 5 [Pseudovirgaria hyperparasitica]